MNQKDSDTIFDQLQNSLREAKQAYRYLRDNGKTEEASEVKNKIAALNSEIDNLLSTIFSNWNGDAEKLIPELEGLNKQCEEVIEKIKKGDQNLSNVNDLIKVLSSIISTAVVITT